MYTNLLKWLFNVYSTQDFIKLFFFCRAYVSMSEKTRAIGVSAKNQCITNLKNTFSCFKRFIGRQFDDPLVQKELTDYPKPYTVAPSPSGGILLQVSNVNCFR